MRRGDKDIPLTPPTTRTITPDDSATEPSPVARPYPARFCRSDRDRHAWAVFAAWALARRPSFAVDRVITITLAAGFSALTTVGAAAVASARPSTAGELAVAGIGLTLTDVAAIMLVRARSDRADLLAPERARREPFCPT